MTEEEMTEAEKEEAEEIFRESFKLADMLLENNEGIRDQVYAQGCMITYLAIAKRNNASLKSILEQIEAYWGNIYVVPDTSIN